MQRVDLGGRHSGSPLKQAGNALCFPVIRAFITATVSVFVRKTVI
ncbi:hypothetical protein K788_0001802 (plasmid) [Paraburkholderia caribensis MBA4]|uniref:Uncharacterized protein n=1 Tax=Paraburkholderia caribensis MBA4 TaxID=1323664 RepID=A0A0P0RQS0_9BURK|nr:hypothetical protein K788_0001802 [Paraburkholderia caribensis MBA4]